MGGKKTMETAFPHLGRVRIQHPIPASHLTNLLLTETHLQQVIPQKDDFHYFGYYSLK